MNILLFEKLHAEGLIGDASLKKIKAGNASKLLSLYWELKTLLYLGVLLLSGGIGILVYKSIDILGHQVILSFMALVCTVSFFYCFKKRLPFSLKQVASPNAFFDYILLLACLTFISFIGYIQYQYQVLGNHFGLATFTPMLVLFFIAYYFDHVGILSLAITNFAAWAGIAVTPAKIMQDNNFNSTAIIVTGLLLGILLIAAGFLTKKRNIKAHFQFTYTNFGTHLLYISCLAGMFKFESYFLLWFLLLACISYFFYNKGVKEKSFYFLLILTIYFYIGLSYSIIRLLFDIAQLDLSGVYLVCIYFIASAIAFILFLIMMNKKLKTL